MSLAPHVALLFAILAENLLGFGNAMGLCRKQNRILDFLNHFNFINLIVSLFITSTLAFRRNCCYLMSQSRQKFSSNSNESMREVRVKGIRSSSFLRSVASSAATEGSETPTILYEGMHGISTSLTLLEHVNLNIPEHKFAIPFYLDILGFGLDPRRAQNVVKGSGTVWYEFYSFSLDSSLWCNQIFFGH